MLDKKFFYINGKWINPKNSKEIKVIDPATEKECQKAILKIFKLNRYE